MLFFKRILSTRKAEPATDRRGTARYTLQAGFPLKTMIGVAGRDELGQVTGGRIIDWTGRLINLSGSGAQVQMPRTIIAERGDSCRLKLDMQGYVLTVPGSIAHVAERRDSLVFGLALDLAASSTAAAYRQLVEIVALGSTLKQTKPLQPDDSGYLVEQFEGEPLSRLIIWRQMVGREIAAFEFRLKECVVRGLAGCDAVECFAGPEARSASSATGVKRDEIHRLYQWVVLNLAPELPEDVRGFLRSHAA